MQYDPNAIHVYDWLFRCFLQIKDYHGAACLLYEILETKKLTQIVRTKLKAAFEDFKKRQEEVVRYCPLVKFNYKPNPLRLLCLDLSSATAKRRAQKSLLMSTVQLYHSHRSRDEGGEERKAEEGERSHHLSHRVSPHRHLLEEALVLLKRRASKF